MQTQIGSEKLSRRERRERRLQEKFEAKRLAREIKLAAVSTEPSVASAVEPEPEVVADSVPPPPESVTRLIQPQSSSAGTKSSSAGPKHVSPTAFIVTATTLVRCRTKSVEIIASSQQAEPELRKIDPTRIWEIDGLRLLDRQLRSLLRSKTITSVEIASLATCVSIEELIHRVRRLGVKPAKGSESDAEFLRILRRASIVESRLNTLNGIPLWIRKNGRPTEEGRLIWAAFRKRMRHPSTLYRIENGGIQASPEMESLLGAA